MSEIKKDKILEIIVVVIVMLIIGISIHGNWDFWVCLMGSAI